MPVKQIESKKEEKIHICKLDKKILIPVRTIYETKFPKK